MDNRIEISIYVSGGTVLPQFLVKEEDLAQAVRTLENNIGTVTATNGMVVKASQVVAFQVVR